MSEIFLIEPCNFVDFPIGGQLSFCIQLIEVFPVGQFKLVGITTDINDIIGSWQEKTISGKKFHFFPVHFIPKNQVKGIIPGRLRFLLSFVRYNKAIFKGVTNNQKIFTHAPETLISLQICRNNYKKLHFMHGVENPLLMPRYKWGKYFSSFFWKIYINALEKSDYIAATADYESIKKFVHTSNFKNRIVRFPNRYDDNIFKNNDARNPYSITFIYCGRINIVKGWDLLIRSFHYYLKNFNMAELIIVGDGEDRHKLEAYILKENINNFVKIKGFLKREEVSEWLNKSHVFLLTSFKEGWPIAMAEALACGLPVVATDVSGASDMINQGVNGYIIKSRNLVEFAEAMFKAAKLEIPNDESLRIISRYKLSGLKQSLEQIFPMFFQE